VTNEEFRLRLQMEVTLLVWVRTSLALMGFGFVIARFGLFLRELAEVGSVKVVRHARLGFLNSVAGTGMIVMGVVVLLIAVFNHQRLLVQVQRGDLRAGSRWSLGVILGILLAALGMGMSLYLALIQL
jgi:putative membrane protein